MSLFTVLAGSKIVVGALTFGTLAAGGTAAAAYTGDLPSSLQQGAHSFIGAPAPTDESDDTTTEGDTTTTATDEANPSPSATPVGPDATGPAAFGLCNAYTHGGVAVSSTAYGSLVVAADGVDNIADYCTTVTKPGKSAGHRPISADAEVTDTSDSLGSTDDADESSDTSQQTEVKKAPKLPAQSDAGKAHKPAKAGRP